MKFDRKIVIPGGAGLVGQNLVAHLKRAGYKNLIVLDKHKKNLEVLKRFHDDIIIEYADLAEPESWDRYFENADVVVMLQAQIGDLNPEPFVRNNVTSTVNVIAAIKKYNVPYTVHISSSVVKSVADDHYTNTKKEQEQIVIESGINCVVLRPTLMFGWFDRKHLGWLARFMAKVPVFPIPGNGKYMRQPLYAGDFCSIITSCIEKEISGEVYNITGLERIDYIDIIRTIKQATNTKAIILKIPYSIFYVLLKVWAIFDKNPPFTADQLKALVAHDEFEEINWPEIFSVKNTSFQRAIQQTFNDPVYGKVELEF
ncbi:MAG: NAD-dependent epimerase/dehydratase family protein [Pseudomonadota bacterium]